MMIQVKRVYAAAEAGDGRRFLVDRLWPRGIKKESLKLAGWIPEVAPSSELRKWFGHDPKRWPGFRERYTAELKRRPETWKPLIEAADEGKLTLLFGARETEHNNAVALKEFLEEEMSNQRRSR